MIFTFIVAVVILCLLCPKEKPKTMQELYPMVFNRELKSSNHLIDDGYDDYETYEDNELFDDFGEL